MVNPRVGRSIKWIAVFGISVFPWAGRAQTCRLSVAGLNQSRRVTGSIHAECPTDLVHSAPFGNWGVTSNFGQKGDSHQFDGWCHDVTTCDNRGACRTSCMDGWYEWNSCTDHPLYQAPNCSLYNAANCTEQTTSTGINVHGTRVVDLPVTCPRDTNGDGVPDAGGCKDIAQYASGTNFMSLYELDPVCCDQLVQTVYYSPVTLPLSCDSLGCAPIGSSWMDPVFWDSPSTPAKVFAQLSVVVNWGAFVNTNGRCSVPAASASVVSAASFTGPTVAPNSIATIFGNQLSPIAGQATTIPLPTTLAGVSVSLTDRAGMTFAAPLFYVSSQQINFLLPAGMSAGPATVAVNGNGVARATGNLQIESTAPAIFTQNADGKGVPAALVGRVGTDGSIIWEPAYSCTAGPGSCQPAAIDLKTGQSQVYLVLFGTGIRNRRVITDVSATIDGLSVPVLYAGDQGQFLGLDQVNLLIPSELSGHGVVDLILMVNSKAANTVRLAFH